MCILIRDSNHDHGEINIWRMNWTGSNCFSVWNLANFWVLAWEILDEITIIKTSVPNYDDVPMYCQVSLLNIDNRFSPVCMKTRVTGRLAYFVRSIKGVMNSLRISEKGKWSLKFQTFIRKSLMILWFLLANASTALCHIQNLFAPVKWQQNNSC